MRASAANFRDSPLGVFDTFPNYKFQALPLIQGLFCDLLPKRYVILHRLNSHFNANKYFDPLNKQYEHYASSPIYVYV